MKRQILYYNRLVKRYYRYRRKLNRVQAGTSRYKRIDLLVKRIKQLYARLLDMRTSLKLGVASTALAAGMMLAPIQVDAQNMVMRTDMPIRHAHTNGSAKPAFADVDGDGDLDLFIGGRSETAANVEHNDILYFENVDGIFQNGAVNPFPDSLNIDPVWADTANVSPAFVDYDMDDDPDCFIGQYNGNLLYYRNDGGTMVGVIGPDNPFDGITVPESKASPTFEDVDGDGDMDAVIGKSDGNIAYYENVDGAFVERTGEFNPFDEFNVTEDATPAFADLDGDGDMDLFVGNKEGVINYFENDGGAWTANAEDNPLTGIKLPAEDPNSAPAFADLDLDGDMDLIVGQRNPGLLFYYENVDGSFEERNDNQLGITRLTFDPNHGVVDADGDGDLDIFAGMGEGFVEYFRNDGGTFARQDSANNPLNTGVFKASAFAAPTFADLDNDGDMDCIMGTWEENIFYLVNDGSNVFTRDDANNPFNGIDPGDDEAISFADWDGDGDLDAFIGNKDGQVKYYRNDGTVDAPAFVEAAGDNPFGGIDFSNTVQPNWATRVTMGDYDSDGDIDGFVGQSNGIMRFYENDGGSLTEQEGKNPFAGYDFGRGLSPDLADLDGDGDLDMLIAVALGATYYFENTGTVSTVNPVLNQNTNLYPNPAVDQITLEIPWSKGEAVLELINSSGQMIYTTSLTETEYQFNIARLTSGIYFVRINAEEGTAVKTFVKE